MKYSKHRRSRRLSKSRKSVNSQKRPKSRKLRKSQRRRKTRKISKSQKRRKTRKTRKISKSPKRSKRRKSRKSSKSRESMKVMRGGVKVAKIEDIHKINYESLRTKLQDILKYFTNSNNIDKIGICNLLIQLFPSFDLTQTAVEQRSEQQSRVSRPTRQESIELENEKRKVMTAAFYPEFDFTRQDSKYETIRDEAKKYIILLLDDDKTKFIQIIENENKSVNACINLFLGEIGMLPKFVKPKRQLSEAQQERSRQQRLEEQHHLQSQSEPVGEPSGTGAYGPVLGLAERSELTSSQSDFTGYAPVTGDYVAVSQSQETSYGAPGSHYGKAGIKPPRPPKPGQGPPPRPTAQKPEQ